MSLGQTAAVGTTITRGGQAANTMSQQTSPGAFDVWTHSFDGMANRMQSGNANTVNLLSSDPSQLASIASSAGNMQSSSLGQVGSSMSAQAGALGDSVNAIGEAEGALQTVGATFAMLTSVEQMLSSALSFIPFPAFPALRIADFDIGLPHAHSHPPNLIPPAPPVPLPSTGPVIPIPILSGAAQTLINGMPAARCGDMGLGVWCGGYFPMYEVFLGSSNVWIEGARAARLLVDITKHCMFTVPKPSDPPLGPMIGTTISASPNVLIGGIPMPSLTALAMGKAMQGAFKLIGKGAKTFGRLTAPLRRRAADAMGLENGFLRCKILRAEPVNMLTGEVCLEQQDFSLPGIIPLAWARTYGSRSSRKGVCGYGWSTQADARLCFEEDGAVLFHDGFGGTSVFPCLPHEGSVRDAQAAHALEVSGEMLRVRVKNSLTYVFPRTAQAPREIFVDRLEDSFGNFVRFVRDAEGLREMIESAGRRIEVESKDGLVRELRIRLSEHQPPRVLARYEYSRDDELIAVYDALNHPYRYRYEHRRLVQHTNRNGLSFYYEYDGDRQSARCVKTWGDDGLYSYTFAFDPVLRRISTTNSLGATSSAQLNDLNLPVWEIDPLGGITKYEYDERGRTVAVTDRDGNGSHYRYDDRGNLVELTRADGSSLKIEFSEADKPICVTDPNGGQWSQKWDAHGLLRERTTPLGNVSRYEYDSRGLLVAFADARGARTRMTYDAVGNLTALTDALGAVTRFGYDTVGNLTARVDALGRKWHYRYDAKDQLVEVRRPSGESLSCEYDPQGNLTRHTNERGMALQFEYFGLGLLKRRRHSDGTVVEYGYDTEERLISVTNQRGETYRLNRDALGRVFEEVDYWGQAITLSFDSSGHLKESRDALGRVVHFTTDRMGRVVSKRFAHPLKPKLFSEESFEFDAAGYLVACSNEHIRVERRFDADGRLVEERQGDFVIKNTFDEAGNRIRRETSHGNAVSYSYNLLGQVESIGINDEPLIRIERDAEGQVRKEVLGAHLEHLFEYDSDGRLTRQGIQRNSSWLFNTQYQYDAAGNLTIRRDSAYGVDEFEYDPVGRVIRHTDPEGQLSRFFQDPAGDRLETEVVSGEHWSRLGQYGGIRYGFDRAGQLTQRHREGVSTSLVWDATSRLVQVQTDDAATTYGYDPLGRRIFKQSASGTSRFQWDLNALAGEQTDERAAREYVYYPNTFKPVALIESPETFYYVNDPNGCPVRVLSASGEVVWAARYGAQGEATVLNGTAAFNPLRLQGQYADEETGLHYNLYRYYDPVIGQFISQDPLGLIAGSNFYEYAPNTLIWADPLGLGSNTHHLTAWIERNGKELYKRAVDSGGQTAEQAGRYGLNSHTEPKYLREFGRKIKPGDVVHMQGTRDPCGPGCRPLLRDLANGEFVPEGMPGFDPVPATRTVYHATDTGRTWTFRQPMPGEFGNLRAEVVVDIQHADGSLERRRYWRSGDPENNKWTFERVNVSC